MQVNMYVIIFKRSYTRPLDDQENIICTLPSHIDTRTVVAICEGRVRL